MQPGSCIPTGCTPSPSETPLAPHVPCAPSPSSTLQPPPPSTSSPRHGCQALQTLLLAPLAWLLGLARSVRSVTGAALSLGAALLRASTRLGWSPGAAAAGAATGPGLAGLAAEVSLALRTSALTTASRAAHAVLRFILHLGELAVRHRHTLRLRAARAVSGVRARVAAAAAPGRRAGGGAPPGRCAPVSSSARSAEARAVDDDTKPLLLGGQAQCGCTLHGHEE